MKSDLASALAQGDQTKVVLKTNQQLGLDVRVLENEDGSICVNAEDAAIGFGWTRVKNNTQYVMWDRFTRFCEEVGFPHKCGKDDYIPESLFYRLGMKASNEKAQKFQGWLADEVIPEIRKTGSYKQVDPFAGLTTEMKAVLMLDKRSQEHDSRLSKLENNMTIDHGQQLIINQMVNTRATEALGGKTTMAYKLLSKKTFPEVYRTLKNHFQVPSYRDIPVKRFEEAKEIVLKWTPSKELNLMIIGANAQCSLDEQQI